MVVSRRQTLETEVAGAERLKGDGRGENVESDLLAKVRFHTVPS